MEDFGHDCKKRGHRQLSSFDAVSPCPTPCPHLQVCSLQRHFVVVMLKSASFNKLLSAARECLYMLRRSAGLMSAGKESCLKVRGDRMCG